MRALRCFALGLIVLHLTPLDAFGQQTEIFVNDQPLPAAAIASYSVDLPPGRYWYDPVSGLWGAEGGPSVGQVAAGLPLGGPLQPDASRSMTDVFINNREIHVSELQALIQIFGQVPPGRYWLSADLVGGLEGQPASFDLKSAAAPPSGGTEGGYFEDRVTDFCVRNDCPSDLRGTIDDMNSYVPDYGSD